MGLRGVGGALRPLFRSLAIAASGMSAQHRRLDVMAENIANAETTRTAAGGPYQRKVVELVARPASSGAGAAAAGVAGLGSGNAAGSPFAIPEIPEIRVGAAAVPAPQTGGGVAVAGVATDTSKGPLVYDPGNPDANADGYVRYPNVNITDETVDMMEARRVYEANATVFQAMKSMLQRATSI